MHPEKLAKKMSIDGSVVLCLSQSIHGKTKEGAGGWVNANES